jgi:hypothetical protein
MGKCEAKLLRLYIETGKTEYNYEEFYDELRNTFLNKAC